MYPGEYFIAQGTRALGILGSVVLTNRRNSTGFNDSGTLGNGSKVRRPLIVYICICIRMCLFLVIMPLRFYYYSLITQV